MGAGYFVVATTGVFTSATVNKFAITVSNAAGNTVYFVMTVTGTAY